MDVHDIPTALHPLIPFIERWSFSDDDERLKRLTTATAEERAEFLAVMRAHQQSLNAWLLKTGVPKSESMMAIVWLDVAAAELEAIESKQRQPKVLSQVITAFLMLCGCALIGLLIAIVYRRLTRQ